MPSNSGPQRARLDRVAVRRNLLGDFGEARTARLSAANLLIEPAKQCRQLLARLRHNRELVDAGPDLRDELVGERYCMAHVVDTFGLTLVFILLSS